MNNTKRRDFLKTFGAITAGGMTGLAYPGTVEAFSRRKTAIEELGDAPTTLREELFWKYIRTKFVMPHNLIYMNTGTEGSMPRFVLHNLRSDLRDFAEQPMDAILYDERCSFFLRNVRAKSAEFLGVDDKEIIMTTNTTEGLGWITNGLDFHEGDEIITTLHFEPYNYCLHVLRDRKKIALTELELPTPAQSKEEIIEVFENAITPNTKMICFCHINFVTGLRLPVKEICEIARANNIITLVDGAHAIGHIDLDLRDLDVDFYATSPHKWLCAPPGTGILYMREEMHQHVWPTVTEFYISGMKLGESFQYRGQQTTPALACVMDVMDFQNWIGRQRIENRSLALSSFAKEKVIDNWGEQSLYSPLNEEISSGLVSFNPFDDHYEEGGGGHGGPPSADKISKLFSALWDRNIITRPLGFKNLHSDPKRTRVLRLSTHFYNNFDQIDAAIDEIIDIADTL